MPLADDSGYEVGVHGAYCSAVHVGDLEERVGDAPSAAFAVDDLTDPPAAFMRLHQHRVADADLQKYRFKRRAAGDRRHRPLE